MLWFFKNNFIKNRLGLIAISRHNRAIRKLLNIHFQKSNVENAYAHHISGYPRPKSISNHIPDIFLKFSNGREKIIEVDTMPMTSQDTEQTEVFQRSADAKPNVTSYNHYFAGDVL